MLTGPSMRTSILFAAVATLAGCAGTLPTDGDAVTEHIEQAESACTRDGRLTVMTQNVYLGADIDPILSAQHDAEVPVAVAAAWAQLEGNDTADRAAGLAALIARKDPALVGLQEVALFRRFPGDGSAPIEIDFLDVLMRSLKARGLRYHVAIVQKDSDVTVPMLAGIDAAGAPLLDGVQMIDRDAILVRDGIVTAHPRAARYAVALPVSFADVEVEIVRGWASVEVETEGGRFRFMTTHLEDHVPEIQAAQAAELLSITDAERLPIVLTGDFNSPADGSGTPTYTTVVASGFSDAWLAARPRDPGYSCCRGADLRVFPAPLTQRLDIVFVRGHSSRGIPGIVTADLVGDRASDRTRGGRWPSDHAGLVTTFRSPTAW